MPLSIKFTGKQSPEGGVASDNEPELSAGGPEGSLLRHQEAICDYQKLEDHCLGKGGEHVLEMLHNLRHFQAQLRREDMQNAQQITLKDVWGRVT